MQVGREAIRSLGQRFGFTEQQKQSPQEGELRPSILVSYVYYPQELLDQLRSIKDVEQSAEDFFQKKELGILLLLKRHLYLG